MLFIRKEEIVVMGKNKLVLQKKSNINHMTYPNSKTNTIQIQKSKIQGFKAMLFLALMSSVVVTFFSLFLF